MTALLERTNERTQGMERFRQKEALERLVSLLQAASPEFRALPPAAGAGSDNSALSNLARLRQAHAVYMLTAGGEVERVGEGAWMLHRTGTIN